LRLKIDRYWFGESASEVIKPLRDLVLNVELSDRLREEVQKWFSPAEFRRSLPEPQSHLRVEEREEKYPEKARTYAVPDRNWWFRLSKLFRKSLLEYLSNERNYTTLASEQLKSVSKENESRRVVYADLTTDEYRNGLDEFAEITKGLNGVIRSLYEPGFVVWGSSLTGFELAFLSLAYLSQILVHTDVLQEWLLPISLGVFVTATFALLYPALGWLLHRLTLDYDWSTENLAIEMVRGVVMAVLLGSGLYCAFLSIPSFAVTQTAEGLSSAWQQLIGRALIIGGATFVAFLLSEHAVVYVMEKLSKRFRFAYDETFTSVARVLVVVYVILFTSCAFVLGFGTQLGISSPDTVVIVYSVVGTLVTASIGYASRSSIESFFAGLMLRISPTFEVGDTVMLEDLPEKKLCRVVEIGLRTVRLYDISSNTEVSVPNSKLSGMVVSNISRPDLELRLQAPVMLRAGRDSTYGEDTLSIAERIMLDIAYQDPEVDQAALSEAEVKNLKSRVSIDVSWERLKRYHQDVDEIEISTAENATWNNQKAGPAVQTALNTMKAAREAYRVACRAKNEKDKLEAMKQVLECYHILCRTIDALAETRTWIKDDENFQKIDDELSREPVVHSQFGVAGNQTYITAILNVFVVHLQRRLEVENSMNKAILETLGPRGLLFTGTSTTGHTHNKPDLGANR
jgi:small-conductance mechanosensitive channel